VRNNHLVCVEDEGQGGGEWRLTDYLVDDLPIII
jgi:hypothetical protein